MPNTIKYSTSGDTQSLEKGNFFIGVGDVPKGPTSTTGHWQGITPPISGYTIYANKASEGPSIMVAENDAKLVEFTNGFSAQEFNYISNGGNFTDGTISPFISSYDGSGGVSTVVPLLNDIPYVGTQSKNALYLNYNGGRMMYTDNLLTTGVTYTFSFWAKIISGTTMTISWNNQNGLGETNAWTSSAILTTQWARYSQTFVYNLPRTRFYFNTSNPSNPERAAIFTEFKVTTGSTYGGPGLQNATEALRWFGEIPQDKICVNRDYEPIVTNGLVVNVDPGYTPSYPTTGTTIYNTSYINQNGTLYNGPSYSSDGQGSILFDGINDYLQFSSGFDEIKFSGTSPYTIEMFVKLSSVTSGTYRRLIDKEGTNLGSRDGYNMLVTKVGVASGNTRIDAERWNSGLNYGGGSITKNDGVLINVWNHFAWSYNTPGGFNSRFYNNGSLGYSGNVGGSITNVNRPLTLMGTTYNHGYVSIFRIYNRALSASEILQNYQAQFPRFLSENIVTSGLVNYLDAGYMGSYPTTGTTWYDVSGYNKNGTLTNGPTYSTDGGGSIVFDGIDDSVTLGSFTGNFISNPSLNNGVISFSCWVFVSSSSSYYIISSGAQTVSTGVAFSYQNGNPFVSVKGQDFTATINISTLDFPLNNWINFTFVANGSSLVTYKNGVLLQSTNYVSATLSDADSLLTIARPNNTTLYTLGGKVAITSFYNKALSSTEVLQNFNAQKSRFGL
jgi:hypothetical protein